MEQVQKEWGVESQHALEMAQNMKRDSVEPSAEYVAAAGYGYGWVKVWKIEDGYLVYWGNNAESYAVFEEHMNIEDEDELAEWLEWQDLDNWESIEQRANVRGADAIPEEGEDEEGPFYVLKTRRWYGATETSNLIRDESGREPLEFETYEEAREWIKAADDCVYYLAHNESSRPSYKVVAVE